MGSLIVYRSSQGANNPLVEIEGDQGNSWRQWSIEANVNSGEKVCGTVDHACEPFGGIKSLLQNALRYLILYLLSIEVAVSSVVYPLTYNHKVIR